MRFFLGVTAAALLAGAAEAQILRTPTGLGGGGADYLPVEITEAAPEAMAGELKRGQVIAQHGLRASEAVVLTTAVRARHRELPAGTPLALVILGAEDAVLKGEAPLPVEAARRAWCDVRDTGRLTFGNLDCLGDTDGDGVFDRAYTGKPASSYFAYSINKLLPEETVVRGSYRVARPDERPATRVGYRYCEGDGVSAPPRFATAVAVHSGDWGSGVIGGCTFGEWPDAADKSAVKVDRLTLKLEPGVAPSGPRFRVLDRIAPGPIARVEAGKPIRALAETPTARERLMGLVEEMTQEPLRTLGAATVNAGPVKKGGIIAQVPVAHGITGVLKNEVKPLGLFARGSLPVGTPMYGVPMMGSGGMGVIWCAPRSAPKAKGGGVSWSTVCLPGAGGSYRWVSAFPPLFVRALSYNQNTSMATAPTVERQAVELAGPMTLAYRFVEWDEKDADVEARLLVGGEDLWAGGLSLKRAADGTALLETMEGVIRLKPAGTDRRAAVVELVEPLKDGARPKL